MRFNPSSPSANLQAVIKQLAQEYPDVPADVTALVAQLAIADTPPDAGLDAILAQSRRLLGHSILLQAIRSGSTNPALALAS